MEVIINAVIESGFSPGQQLALPGLEEKRDELHQEWESVSEREGRSRTLFAQETIHPDDVAAELQAVRAAIGRGTDVQWFMRTAIDAQGGSVTGEEVLEIDPRELPTALSDLMPSAQPFEAKFELPVETGQVYLNRAHPAVAGLANYVFESALDNSATAVARRCGVIRTNAVDKRTTLVLARLRFSIKATRGGHRHENLAEELRLLAFEGAPGNATWLDDEAAEALLDAKPTGNVDVAQARNFIRRVTDAQDALSPALDQAAHDRAVALLEAHERVREASRARGRKPEVEPFLPVDVLGVYIYLPAGV